jgi:polar amino acid transport system permease protein
MMNQKFSPLNKILSFIGISAAVSLLFYFLLFSQSYQWKSVWEYRHLFMKGWLVTVILSSISLILSGAIGLVTALLRRSGLLIARYLSIVYIELIRGTPLLVQILFFFYVIANAIGMESRYAAGVLTLSLFSGAYIAEIIRAGIESIRQSELESAKAIGLTPVQTYRFIIFPQTFRQILPPLAGQFASIIKDSSLLSIIGINELTNSAQQVNSATYSTLESFFPLAIGYLILTLPISLWSKRLEKRFRYEA